MCSPSAPDTTLMQQAAVKTADLGDRALKWYQEQYAAEAPARAAAAERANAVSDAQLAAMKAATEQAQGTQEFQDSTLRPLQRRIATDATNFNTEAEREKLAGKALGDVNEQYGAARDTTARNMTRSGVNPSDGSYGAGQLALTNAQALAGADAKTKSRQQSITLGDAKLKDAASILSGLPGNQATTASLALNAGNASVGNAGVPLTQAQQAAAQVGQGYQQAMGGQQASGNLYGQVANIQGSANNDGLFSTLGNVAGRVGAAYITSDKHQKKDRKPVKGEVALAAARRMPVDSWKYKASSPASDGGKTHIGPMAQDARKAAGERMAPGGKLLNVADEAGMTLAAVKHLDKKVTRLEKRVG